MKHNQLKVAYFQTTFLVFAPFANKVFFFAERSNFKVLAAVLRDCLILFNSTFVLSTRYLLSKRYFSISGFTRHSTAVSFSSFAPALLFRFKSKH